MSKSRSKKFMKLSTEHQPFVTYTGGGSSNCSGADLTNAYPAEGPPAGGYGFLPASVQRGGSCGCGGGPMYGGAGGNLYGGRRRRGKNKGGGCIGCMGGGSGGVLAGGEWTSNASTWPGVSGQNTGTHYPMNSYNNDPQLAMIATGAQPPFSVGGGRRRRHKKQLGGGLIDSLSYNIGSAFNTFRGLPQTSPDPIPFKGQFPNKDDMVIVK